MNSLVKSKKIKEFLHVKVGGENWEPTKKDLNWIANLFKKVAPNDAIIVTCNGVHATYVGRERNTKQVRILRYLCGAIYQAAGAYDLPTKFLDILSNAANGDIITTEQVNNLLPCDAPDYQQTINRLQRDLQRCKQIMECNDPSNARLIFGESNEQPVGTD